MIVKKDKTSFQTQLNKPYENFGGDDYFLVEDYTELYDKIIENFPYIDFVVQDNVLMDVVLLEKPQEEPLLDDLLIESMVDLEFRVSMIEMGVF